MSKKIAVIILAVIILAGGAFLVLKGENSDKNNIVSSKRTINSNEMVFFYGDGCPHCTNVEIFLEANKDVEERIKFEKLEVWKNKENADLMKEGAKICGLDLNNLGVPLFWDGSKCFLGDSDIINLLKEKAGIQ